MNKLKTIIGVLLLTITIVSCSNSEPKSHAMAKIAKDSISKLDTTQWTGSYQGTVPDNKGISLQMALRLLPSNTYELKVTHLRKNPNDNIEESFSGNINWAEDSTTIVLDELDSISNKFRIRPGSVEYLNPDATPNSGELSEFYILKKQN